jgi:hypothetical protein
VFDGGTKKMPVQIASVDELPMIKMIDEIYVLRRVGEMVIK